LTHIFCSECSADLDWAQPEFVDRHPAPLCARCRQAVESGELVRSVVFGVIEDGGA
jgi:hypothetical protein